MKKNNNIIFLLVFLFLSVFSGSGNSQPEYKFNFDKEWEWVEFIYGGHEVSEEAKSLVDYMNKTVDIVDGRILFKQLSLLESVNDILRLTEIARLDSSIIKNNHPYILDSLLHNFYEQNTLNGLIYAAYKLFLARGNPPFSSKTFVKKEMLTSIDDTVDAGFELNFDYTNAELILNLLENEKNDFYNVIKSKSPDFAEKIIFDENTVNDCFRNAIDNSPLYTIYKLIFPESYGNLGGIYIYKELYRRAIFELKSKEQQIKFEVKNRVFQFLPSDMNLNTNLKYTLGLKSQEDFNLTGNLIYNLEYSGNDHRQVFINLTRSIFNKGKSRIYLDIIPYLFDKSDTLYAKIISAVHDGGMINYIAPTSIDNRPLTLLEKDFMHFRRTCNEIKSGTDPELIDTLIKNGLEGLGLFYTMGTQMTFTIEKVLGKSAIKNSMIHGPFYFFGKYIDSYREDPKNIRIIFRFPEDFEEKINLMGRKISNEIISDVSKLSSEKGNYLQNDIQIWNDTLIRRSLELQNKYGKKYNGYQVYLLTGELFLANKLFSDATESFLKAYFDVPDKERFFNIISGKMFDNNAYKECLEFTDEFLKLNRNINNIYLMRAKCFIKTGNDENAIKELETVLSFDPDNIEANILLHELK